MLLILIAVSISITKLTIFFQNVFLIIIPIDLVYSWPEFLLMCLLVGDQYIKSLEVICNKY